MNKTLLVITCACVVIAIFSPIVVYLHFKNTLELHQKQIQSYQLQLSELQNSPSLQWNEEHQEIIADHMQPYDPYLMEPYLVTRLGWYLHDSSDTVPWSRNQLHIYGRVWNIGAETAYNCKLIVYFYSNNTVIQTSEINMGTIRYWDSYKTRENINCELADYVTKIEVERTWANLP